MSSFILTFMSFYGTMYLSEIDAIEWSETNGLLECNVQCVESPYFLG